MILGGVARRHAARTHVAVARFSSRSGALRKLKRAHLSRPMSATTATGDNVNLKFPSREPVVVYAGRRQVLQRRVTYPDGREHTFEYVKGGEAVLVLPWCVQSRSATLLREYQPGADAVMWGCVAGGVDPGKSPLDAARLELEEEAHLQSETWIPLLETDQGAAADKYSDGIFHPYLALDCTAVAEPKARQKSEYIEICSGVGHDELMDIVVSGRMNTVGLSCVLLALRTLERNGVPLR